MTPISGIEFLVWLLIAAAIIAMLAARLRIPYTVCLVLGGLLLGVIRIPILSPLQPGHRPDWLTPDVILILFLPALVFEGSVKLDVRELLRNSVPLLLLANAGVLLAALVTGYLLQDSASLAACSRMGRTSRGTGARSGAELEQHVSLSRANLELDVRRGHLFHCDPGTHNQAPRKSSQTREC